MASYTRGSHGCDFRYIIYNTRDVVARTTRTTTTTTMRQFNHSLLTPNIFFSPSIFLYLMFRYTLYAQRIYCVFRCRVDCCRDFLSIHMNIRYKLSSRSGNVHYNNIIYRWPSEGRTSCCAAN